jgi:hypothetical protein
LAQTKLAPAVLASKMNVIIGAIPIVNLLLDARDLIELVERGRPATVQDVETFLRAHDHEFVFSFTNIRELVGTLAFNGDFLRVRPWLQSLERTPHLYIRETLIPRDEIQAAVDAFNGGTAYLNPSVLVRRWDETLIPLPPPQMSEIEQLVNVRLDDIVYWIFQGHPATFAPPERHLGTLRRQFEEDRRALQAGEAPSDEHFIRVVKKHSATHRIQLPAGREDEFAKWIYASPDRCPGLHLGHEVYRALMENVNDIPEAGDFSDLAHVYALPYVQSATLDRRMRHYLRIASDRLLARGALINYSERVRENLAVFIAGNA